MKSFNKTFLVHTFTAPAVLSLLIAGCASTPSPVPEEKRPSLDVLPGAKFAVLIGEESAGILSPRVYVVAIDGLPVSQGEHSASKPLMVPVGSHKIDVALRAGGFFAQMGFQLTAQPQTTYRVRAQQQQDVPWYRQQIYSAGGPTFFWIEDYATGNPVTQKHKVIVTVTNRGL